MSINEKYIETIEEAVTGRMLTQALVSAFRSFFSFNDIDGVIISTTEITGSEFNELPVPDQTDEIYFIIDAN